MTKIHGITHSPACTRLVMRTPGTTPDPRLGCLQVKERGPVRDGDHSIAAHLLRIKDPETGTGLSNDLLAGEIGMFFTAGTPFPSLVHLQSHLHLDQMLYSWRALVYTSSWQLCK